MQPGAYNAPLASLNLKTTSRLHILQSHQLCLPTEEQGDVCLHSSYIYLSGSTVSDPLLSGFQVKVGVMPQIQDNTKIDILSHLQTNFSHFMAIDLKCKSLKPQKLKLNLFFKTKTNVLYAKLYAAAQEQADPSPRITRKSTLSKGRNSTGSRKNNLRLSLSSNKDKPITLFVQNLKCQEQENNQIDT